MFDYDFLVKAVLFAASSAGVIFVNKKSNKHMEFVDWYGKNKEKLSTKEQKEAFDKMTTNRNDVLIYCVLVMLVLAVCLVYISI